MLNPPLQRMLDQTVYSTPLVRLGRFEARPEDPLFSARQPPGHALVAFPETALSIVFDRGGRHVVDPTCITYYNPDELYHRRAIAAEGDRCNWLSVAPELLAELAATTARAATFSVPVARTSAALFNAQRALFSQATRAADRLSVEERAIALMSQIVSLQGQTLAGPRPALNAASQRCVARAQAFLAAHYAQPTTVAEIARQAHCSAFHLCRIFRLHTGMSLHAYRTALRLRHAYLALSEGPDLSDLALSLGFASHSHFSQRFKAQFGCSPTAMASPRRHAGSLARRNPARI